MLSFRSVQSFGPAIVAAILLVNSLMAADVADRVQLVVDQSLPLAAQHAVDDLAAALKSRTQVVSQHSLGKSVSGPTLVVGIVGGDGSVDALLAKHEWTVPEAAESLLVARIPGEYPAFLIAGRDARGLAYAAYDVADTIRSGSGEVLSGIREVSESPTTITRSTATQLFNADLERHWYESEEYWRWFFQMLARNRFNTYTLIFGHNTNYMIPPYAWMFEVPEYPGVRVEGVDDEERARNLANFRRISELATEYGIDLGIGLWTQLPVVKVRVGLDYGDSPVIGLPEGLEGGDYCAKGLQKLLTLCPEVKRVQLRMNLESGIPHDKQEEYYQAQFAAIAAVPHKVKLDLRHKNLSQRTIDLAEEAGLEVLVLAKYWCEHMGLPFHPTAQDPAYSESRYGFGKLLRRPRNYRISYQLWTVGSSRLLLWGNPEYASRFTKSCLEGAGDSFEVFAPLTNMGYGNDPGEWELFADPELKVGKWNYERYWPFFLAFGRWGYNPETPESVWEREMSLRFNDQAVVVDDAYRAASEVIPLLTATTQFSAASWRFWPEMLPCMHLDAYRAIQPSDYGQFYGIAPFKSGQRWEGEGFSATHSSFVEDAIANNVNAKWTPIEVSQHLNELADTILNSLEEFDPETIDPALAKSTVLDLKVLAHLARYHAAKKLAATHLEFFRLTQDKQRLPLVLHHIRDAEDQWKEIVALTDGAYTDRLVLGFSPEHHSDFPGRMQDHTKHWKDRLGEVRRDVLFVEDLMKNNAVDLESDVEQAESNLKRYPGEVLLASKPTVEHTPATKANAGESLPVHARISSDAPLISVDIHYREMDQTVSWKRLPMTKDAKGDYIAEFPGGAFTGQVDIQYYFAIRVPGGGTMWPRWQEETPYYIIAVAK